MNRLALLGGEQAIPAPLSDGTAASPAEMAAVARALAGTPLTTLFGGHEIERFETLFARRMGAPEAVAVTSGTTALHAAVVAAGIGPGDEVIVTPFSFVASVSVVVQAGARPVFADIDPHTLTLDPADARHRITPRTRAILPVHICGYPADMDGITALAREHGLTVIEDCAAAHGARVGERHVGTIGDYGCFSFNIGKVLRTGEGGMVLTADAASAAALRELRVNGLSQEPAPNGVARLGFNYTMAQPLAAIGCEQVPLLDAVVATRRKHHQRLVAGLDGLGLFTPPDVPGRHRVGYATPFLLPESLAAHRDLIVKAFKAEGVPASRSCPEPLYHIAYLRKFAPRPGLPVAEDVCRRVFSIDPRPSYGVAGIDAIVAGVRKVLTQVDELLAATDGTAELAAVAPAAGEADAG